MNEYGKLGLILLEDGSLQSPAGVNVVTGVMHRLTSLQGNRMHTLCSDTDSMRGNDGYSNVDADNYSVMTRRSELNFRACKKCENLFRKMAHEHRREFQQHLPAP